ncbi:hypothetical protein FGO68_gene13070 [Halteria grandinella]|uniref:Rab-GAP TBC domain-containing protein n=1 Tax=Halteria grandinella TaxID=5974 RepID=A0A8J8P362_HALGN|nr:hypothetical protein FGO68_gene13070 [Halteria grandinella]
MNTEDDNRIPQIAQHQESPRQPEDVPYSDQESQASTKDKESTSDELNQAAHKLEEIKRSMFERRVKKFDRVLQSKVVDLDQLRSLAWSGVPPHQAGYRCKTWKLLLDYLPNDQEILAETLSRKREEYTDMVEHYFGGISYDNQQDLFKKREMSPYEVKSIKQIRIDVYRTQPEVKLFSTQPIQIMMIRILFTWTMRHPASGYVQGINDLAAPLILVYLTEFLQNVNQDNIYEIAEKDIEEIIPDQLVKIEADVFWCLSKLIDDVQDNYTDMQPGVHKIINKMKKLIEQADPEVLKYLDSLDINFMDFAYRWVSCYLTREFDIYQIVRLWDTYLSEEDGFSQFHCYVVSALFLQFSKNLKEMSFQDALLYLQNLPTQSWQDDDLNILMAKSFEMKELYHNNNRLYQ